MTLSILVKMYLAECRKSAYYLKCQSVKCHFAMCSGALFHTEFIPMLGQGSLTEVDCPQYGCPPCTN